MKKIFFAYIFIFISGSVLAQDLQQEYLEGKQFFREGKYSLAMSSLKPLVKVDQQSPFSKYAMFYYALAAYEEGYEALAKDMLLQIQEVYPEWEQMEEVQLWLARLYFEDKRFNQGIYVLNNISGKDLREAKERMLRYHLSQVDDIFLMAELFDAHSSNKQIARRFAQLLAQQPLEQQDPELLAQIIKEFNFDPADFNAGVVTQTEYKGKYKVAVMLPFVYESLQPDLRRKKNQFVLDMYNGIRLAVDSLRQMGVNIKVYAYDTKRDADQTAEILQKEELKSMDLIIGPLFPEPLELVQQFSFENKINMINPLSNNPAVLGKNPFAFLFKPSYTTMGKAMAELAVSEVKNPYGIILYGESETDSLLANAYKETFERDSFKIVLMEKIYEGGERRVLDILTSAGKKLKEMEVEKDEEKKEQELGLTIPLDSIGSIYVASDEGLIITRVLSAIETRKDTIKVYGTDKWLDIKAIDYNALERLDVAMSAPTFFDYSKEWFRKFRKQYVNIHREVPSEFAILGYDIMMFSGTVLNKHGKYFQLALKEEPTLDGFLLTGYNYRYGNDNQVVPIVKVVENEPQIIVIKNYVANEQE